jgi:hypothetical protein
MGSIPSKLRKRRKKKNEVSKMNRISTSINCSQMEIRYVSTVNPLSIITVWLAVNTIKFLLSFSQMNHYLRRIGKEMRTMNQLLKTMSQKMKVKIVLMITTRMMKRKMEK